MIFSEPQMRGQLAMWVARQHPFHSVEGVDAVGSLISADCRGEDWFGPDDCRMRRFASWRSVEGWLRSVIGGSEWLTQWNTPRSGHSTPVVFVSRSSGPERADDFIDIDALIRNIALHAWRESEAEAESNKRIDAEVAAARPE